MIAAYNLLNDLPDAKVDEVTTILMSSQGMRLKRIVSHGQTSPADFWYDQKEAEWVMLLSGSARICIEGELDERTLSVGDAVFLPAHCRHRVAWTDPECPTVWLALFVDQSLTPMIPASV